LQICDDEIFASIIGSGRHFEEFTLDLKNCPHLASSSRLERILQKYGGDLKKLKIHSSIQSKSSEISEQQLFRILQLTPNIEEFIFRNVFVQSSHISLTQQELDLHKLRKLVLDYCFFETSQILNSIPQGLLTELVFTFDQIDEKIFQNFFNRQFNIKRLEILENSELKFEHLQLDHIKISSDIDFAQLIRSQPLLQYVDFAITWVNDDVFAELSKLKHLKTLRTLVDPVSCRMLRSLEEIRTMKHLRLDSHSSHDVGHLSELSMMKELNLEKLTLVVTERKIPDEILIQISNSFKRLKEIEIINRSILIIRTLVEHFPQLESIVVDFYAIFGAPNDVLVVDESVTNTKLKQLVITNIDSHEEVNTKAILKLLGTCRSLEKVMLSKLSEFTNEDFRSILERLLKLTHLSLEIDDFEFNDETIESLKLHGRKLQHLRLSGLSSNPKWSVLKETFEDIFPIVTLYKYSNKTSQLIMKKRRVADWHEHFQLMNHF